MNAKKYQEIRKKRFKDRQERFRGEKGRIERQRIALKQRMQAKAQRRKRTESETYEEKKTAQEKRKRTREAITSVKESVKEDEGKTKASPYSPEMTHTINEMMDKSFPSGDHKKAIELSHEINEFVEKSRSEAYERGETERKRGMEEAKYFYCIIPFSKEESFGYVGMNDSGVYVIPYRDVAAVVSDSHIRDYELTEDNVKRHGEVLSQIMEKHTVVPVEFGTTIKNEKILRSLIAEVYNPVKECLRLVDDKVELGVKALVRNDAFFDDHIRRKECLSDMLTSLNTVARQTVTGDLFSERLILNASFLVDKEDIDAFSEKVTELQQKYPMLKLLYSGPWPPYNFIYIKIGAKGLEFTKKR